LSRGMVCTLRLVFGVQLVLFVGVAVAEVVRSVRRDGVHVGACVWRAPGAVCWRCGGELGGGHGGGRGAVCSVGRCASCGLCLACTWCCLSASRWQRWFGLSRGSVCTLGLVFDVHLVLSVGVAVAGVVQFVPRDGVDGVQAAACLWSAPGAVCWRRGGECGGGHGGGGCAVCPAGRCASCRLCLSCSW